MKQMPVESFLVALGRPMRAAISRTSGLVMPASGKTARES